ncbi:hypothetical protein ACFOLC_05205 [Lysobacter cavernae]|uniref:Uncharacterized protein n=1 Tax=Lysobacter cavernae TaxID=1685901 RepID=A0ABV7RNS6_9GAMM
MKTPTPHSDDRFEREWQAQEHALDHERRGLPLDPADARSSEYRLIARALRAPAMEPLPLDLAARIVRHVNDAQVLGERIERWLLRILTAALALSAAVVMARYGASWVPAFVELLPQASAQTTGWTGLLAACLAVSLLWQWGGRSLR